MLERMIEGKIYLGKKKNKNSTRETSHKPRVDYQRCTMSWVKLHIKDSPYQSFFQVSNAKAVLSEFIRLIAKMTI